jgi:branched-chain amino acid aminotransferase
MPIQTTTNIWHNGTLIPWEQANIHVMSHVIHYGSSVFEGIRCYGQPHGSAVFRLPEHMQRLLDSAKIYRMDLPFTLEELCAGVVDLIEANGVTPCYIRPIALRGYGEIGVSPKGTPVEVYIANFPWGKYIAGHGGADVCISSWHRLAPNTLPSLAKAGANYMNSKLANSTLSGITRDSVLTIARHLGLAVTEQSLPRELLYIADEVFFSGTAAEVSPIRSIDRIVIGDGKTGEITKKIADEFFGIANGLKPDRFGWLTPVKVNAAEPIAV